MMYLHMGWEDMHFWFQREVLGHVPKLLRRRLPEGRRRVSLRVCELSHVWGHGHQSLRAVPEHVSLQSASHQVSLQIVPNQVSLQSTCTNQQQMLSLIWQYMKKSTLWENLTVAPVLIATNVTLNPFEDTSMNPHWGKPYSCSGPTNVTPNPFDDTSKNAHWGKTLLLL